MKAPGSLLYNTPADSNASKAPAEYASPFRLALLNH